MSEHKSEIKRKINNVKEWLNNAEDSFQHDQEVKGQLNLMLAQAEIETLSKKTNAKWHAFKIHIALSALLIVLITYTGYRLFTKEQKIDTIIRSNLPSQEVKPNIIEPNELEATLPKTVDRAAESSSSALERNVSGRAFTENEKQSLIRSAQQSLHGELKR